MKIRAHIAIIVSHLAVLVSLFTPIIRVNDVRMSISGEKLSDGSYIDVIQLINSDTHRVITMLTVILMALHLFGIVVSIYGLIKKGYNHLVINLTFLTSFSSGLMGALHLYLGSYIMFSVCAASFVIMAVYSILLVRKEDRVAREK